MKQFIAFLACFIYLSAASAQTEKWAGIGIEANPIYGKVIKHTKKFRAAVPSSSGGFELNFVKQTYGKKAWEQRRHYPLIGFGIAYINYGMDSIYGKCIGVFPNLEIPLIKGKKLSWTFTASFGLGYATRKFQRYPTWDTLNTAIGSHFNNFSYYSTDVRYRIDKHWDVQAGLNFSHMSNAAFRVPNLGLNMYGAHVGIRYFPVTSQPERIDGTAPPLKNRWLAQARFGIAATESGFADGPLYPVYLASVYASKRYMSKNKAFAGVDYSYHSNIYAFMRNNEIMQGKEKANSWKGSVFFGNEFIYGRIGILMQVGIYFKQAVLKQDAYYEKLGANLYLIQSEKGILKELYTCALLKTHKADAELVEVGLGVGF